MENTATAIVDTPVATKVCKRCGVEKPITEFHRHSRNSDGLQCYCKDCVRAANQEHYKKTISSNKIVANPALSEFAPVDLINELKARGYTGNLEYREVKVHRIKL